MLLLSSLLRAQLFAEARATFPTECCGLIEGVREGDIIRAQALHPSPNRADDPKAGFEIDPAVHFGLLRALRSTDHEVVGCYHSHPNGRAEPSARDRANGCEEGFVWVIVATGVTEAIAAFVGPQFRPLSWRE